ncbi:MAG: zf-HC2 domain-containing protein, partial [Rehaibacterium terrae]
MRISDERLMAYVDGELDAAQAAQVEAAIAADPALAAAVARQRRLRERLRAAFDPVLDQPVPER